MSQTIRVRLWSSLHFQDQVRLHFSWRLLALEINVGHGPVEGLLRFEGGGAKLHLAGQG